MRRARGLGSITVALLLVLTGCAAPLSDAGANTPRSASPGGPGDPSADRLGWEAGYWYNESIDVDQSDGLSDAEMNAYVGRAMARVERIREREFETRVPVNVMTREEFRNRDGNGSGGDGAFSAWNNQVWEALFINGESGDSQSEISDTRGSSVAGFYSPSDDEIKIITPDPESATINNATLVHELVHALQDQHYDLTSKQFSAKTQDGELAINGIVEGDARYVEYQYAEKCGDEWSCVDPSSSDGGSGGDGGGGSSVNLGMFLTIYQPYSDGPVYVHDRLEEGGWDAVNRAFRNPPESSEQTIHLTDEKPTPIRYTDRARNGWKLFPKQGQNGSDTAGEASMFAMFWYQAREYGADTVNPRSVSRASGEYDTYNYTAEPTAGWGNDRIFPYHKGSGDDAKYGYVWVTEWDSRRDATEFRDAYVKMLRAHDAVRRNGVYVIPDGSFADAFRVHQEGNRVVVVNGPTPQAVDDIRPNLAS